MKKIITIAACLASLSLFASVANAGTFQCSNPPQSVWGSYFCVYGSYVDDQKITDVNFGVCRGSTDDAEEEPSEVVELKSVKQNPSLRASSKQWKKANAFDLTSPELGAATLFIHPKAFAKKGDATARLKASLDDVKKDVHLHCYFTP